MRDYSRLMSKQMKEEFLQRLPELSCGGGGLGGLEGLEGGFGVDEASRTLSAMEEGTPTHLDGGLEAIILQFGRPAYFVKGDSFDTERAVSSSAEVDAIVNGARAAIEASIPSVGRIDLRNHRKDWVGTGWLIAPNIVVTNQHVAKEFSVADEDGFAFSSDSEGRTTQARVDLVREHGSGRESVFRVKKIRWVEPERRGHHDVAFLEIKREGEEDQAQPKFIQLMSDKDYAALQPDRWLAVVGYPAFSIYNHKQDQQRIFGGVFNVKRLQPGRLSSVTEEKLLHDATTLGGNSGSVVLDIETGTAAALHFGGYQGKTNYAVAAPVVRRLLNAHVS